MAVSCVQCVWKLAHAEADAGGNQGPARLLQSLVAQGTITVAEARVAASQITLAELLSLTREPRVPHHAKVVAATRALKRLERGENTTNVSTDEQQWLRQVAGH